MKTQRFVFIELFLKRQAIAVTRNRTESVQKLALFIFILIGCQLSLHAANYYVSTNGNDVNNGSESLPWRTIQKAANSMTAGDTVNVAGGNYNELVKTKTHGTSGNPISFIAASGVTNSGFQVDHAWQTITGFNLNGSTVGLYSGIFDIGPNAHNFVCRSNVMNYINTGFHANYLVKYAGSPTNSIYDGNSFLSTPFMGVSLSGSGHLLTNNVWSSQRGGDALRLLCSNTTLTRNTFTNWSDFSGGVNPEHGDLIQAFSNGGEVATNNLIEENLFINCSDVQIGCVSDYAMLGNIGGWTYRNNIWDNVSWVMTINAGDFYFFNNVFYRCGINSAHPINFAEGDGKLIKLQAVDTNADTITVAGSNYLSNAQIVHFVDPDGDGTDDMAPSPLLAFRHIYYIHLLSSNTMTIHTNDSDATNGVNAIHLTNTGQGNIGMTGFYNRNYAHNGKVFNNIFLECGRDTTSWIQGWFGVDSGVTNFQAGYNIVRGTGTGGMVPTYGSGISKYVNANYWHDSYGYGLNGVDPLFVDAPNGDFRLMSNSPAIGAALSLANIFTSDFSGKSRGIKWDIGAYCYDNKISPVKNFRPDTNNEN